VRRRDGLTLIPSALKRREGARLSMSGRAIDPLAQAPGKPSVR
jgi:hypothetical protein